MRGPQVMKGYWNRPDETAKVLDADGWLRTGDIARIDEKGFVYIVDRKKDMILVSGFNVYPNEIEDVVAHDAGRARSRRGRRAGREIRRGGQARHRAQGSGADRRGQVKAHCRENLTGYKQPKYIEFRDSLPKTNVGKILRRELRDPTPG